MRVKIKQFYNIYNKKNSAIFTPIGKALLTSNFSHIRRCVERMSGAAKAAPFFLVDMR